MLATAPVQRWQPQYGCGMVSDMMPAEHELPQPRLDRQSHVLALSRLRPLSAYQLGVNLGNHACEMRITRRRCAK